MRRIVHGAVLLLVSYLSFPLFLGLFPPTRTRVLSETLRGQITGLVVGGALAVSRAFPGAGLFVGVLAALGSSAVAANLIGGLMLPYTSAYQEGDRVSISGSVGIVQDCAVLGDSIVNYSLARREIAQPVVIATTVTIGHDVPWHQPGDAPVRAPDLTERLLHQL